LNVVVAVMSGTGEGTPKRRLCTKIPKQNQKRYPSQQMHKSQFRNIRNMKNSSKSPEINNNEIPR
jgi:hypothetical protein